MGNLKEWCYKFVTLRNSLLFTTAVATMICCINGYLYARGLIARLQKSDDDILGITYYGYFSANCAIGIIVSVVGFYGILKEKLILLNYLYLYLIYDLVYQIIMVIISLLSTMYDHITPHSVFVFERYKSAIQNMDSGIIVYVFSMSGISYLIIVISVYNVIVKNGLQLCGNVPKTEPEPIFV